METLKLEYQRRTTAPKPQSEGAILMLADATKQHPAHHDPIHVRNMVIRYPVCV
jgi:hypothetical protein